MMYTIVSNLNHIYVEIFYILGRRGEVLELNHLATNFAGRQRNVRPTSSNGASKTDVVDIGKKKSAQRAEALLQAHLQGVGLMCLTERAMPPFARSPG